MAITKLTEFAVDGEKNSDGLNEVSGFPVQEKPARQWFNYLLNNITSKSNEIIDSVNSLVDNRASLLDFGAPYSTDSTENLQSALDYLNEEGGGTLYIPYHTGTLVINGNIALYPNICVICDENLIVDCTQNNNNGQFTIIGSVGSEIPLSSNKTSGSTSISTLSNHNLQVGDDVLIVSQRVTSHEDAGKKWRLGETTGSGNSPYFAEPLVVKSLISNTTFASSSPLIFPDYRTDKVLETSPLARDSSTISKINFAKNFSWSGGIFKKNIGDLFYLTWTKNCSLDIEVSRGYGKGAEVTTLYTLKNKIKLKVSRPIDWVLESDHSEYNSIRDISTWYNLVCLDEENGCQGLDQTYRMYCSIYPRYKVRHINSKEDGMTTHGNCYGAVVDLYAVNCALAAFRNRARYVTANIYSVNCGYGLRNSTYGTIDCVFNLQSLDCVINGVSFMSSGVTELTPAIKNTTISGVITMSENSSGTAILISENLIDSDKYVDSRINLFNLLIKSKGRAITAMDYVNAVTLDNVNIDYYGSVSPIWFRYSGGHSISNLTVDFKTGDGLVEAIYGITFTGGSAPAEAYGSPSYKIDYKSCKVINGTLLTNDDRFISTKLLIGSALGVVETVTINNKNIAEIIKLSVFRNTRLENRIVLSNKIPLGYSFELILIPNGAGKEIGLYGDDETALIHYTNGVNDLGGNFISVPVVKKIKVTKIGNKEFIIS